MDMTQSLDRAGLVGLLDSYLDALPAHRANRMQLAGKVHYTENGQELQLDDGLWGTATKMGRYRIDIPDTIGQQVGYLGVVYQQDKPCCIATRLRAEDGYITEIETVVHHPELMGGGGLNGAAALEEMGTPHPVFNERLPASDRPSRRALIETANMYFSGLERNDGTYPTPFTDDCNRLENGMQTTNVKPPEGEGSAAYEGSGRNVMAMSPTEQFKTGFFSIVTAIRNRRFPVVDEENGNVLAFGFFDHNGQIETQRLTDGTEIKAGLRNPFTWQIAELFKVTNGKLRQIEAVLTGVPYGMKCRIWDD
jgi:hypothetical protein